MEEFKKGGYSRREAGDRRDYGSRQSRNGENGERSQSRVKRPRISSSYASPNYAERKTYGSDDRPARNFSGSDNRHFSDRPQRSSYGDRPQRQYGDRPYRESYGDRPQRASYGDRPYGDTDRPRRNFSDRPGRNFQDTDNRHFSDRPQRQYGDRPQRASYGDRPQRASYGDRPYGGTDRPRRNSSDRPGRNFSNQDNRGFSDRKRGFKQSRPAFDNRASEEGINRMISRKPLVDPSMYSDNDLVNIPIKETVRLNKFIANSGVCSRREADNLIQAGVVTVNGEVVTELGSKINIYTDDVRFNGERLKGEEKVYIVMNKPKGYVTTASDPHAEKTVMELLKGCNARVFPVGRLDKNTTGVLMFTNDGEIAEKLTHPSYDKKKIYQVFLNDRLRQEDFDQIKAGVTLTDGEIAADELEYIDEEDHRKLGIEIHSGKNRIVRRIFETLGYEVKALDRVYFAGLTKKGIKRGGWRFLTEGEVNILKMGAYN